MNAADTYKQYAADCMRLADGETTPEARNVMLNMALAWVRLAEQKQAIVPAVAAKSEKPLPGEARKADGTAPPRPH